MLRARLYPRKQFEMLAGWQRPGGQADRVLPSSQSTTPGGEARCPSKWALAKVLLETDGNVCQVALTGWSCRRGSAHCANLSGRRAQEATRAGARKVSVVESPELVLELKWQRAETWCIIGGVRFCCGVTGYFTSTSLLLSRSSFGSLFLSVAGPRVLLSLFVETCCVWQTVTLAIGLFDGSRFFAASMSW